VNERLREGESDGGDDPNKLEYKAELLKRAPIDWFWLATALAIGSYVKQHAWGETILATAICIGAINTRRIANA
jgi:hypothetical protein